MCDENGLLRDDNEHWCDEILAIKMLSCHLKLDVDSYLRDESGILGDDNEFCAMKVIFFATNLFSSVKILCAIYNLDSTIASTNCKKNCKLPLPLPLLGICYVHWLSIFCGSCKVLM